MREVRDTVCEHPRVLVDLTNSDITQLGGWCTLRDLCSIEYGHSARNPLGPPVACVTSPRSNVPDALLYHTLVTGMTRERLTSTGFGVVSNGTFSSLNVTLILTQDTFRAICETTCASHV